ncbi:hypothetical protein BDV29DRAFT_150065 [Aspergillus leporis]|uniref:Uncharacterized protein n=1 Tax=Aspergillus leporis TaxID=41062 RepID=A0A5N5WXN7_9EURO|nr:hypothetical protein BDV29DRAFT_150065 [Aspergillus leporis]
MDISLSITDSFGIPILDCSFAWRCIGAIKDRNWWFFNEELISFCPSIYLAIPLFQRNFTHGSTFLFFLFPFTFFFSCFTKRGPFIMHL